MIPHQEELSLFSLVMPDYAKVREMRAENRTSADNRKFTASKQASFLSFPENSSGSGPSM